ncbi:DUF6746 family protein [Halomonas cerina]|uniref:Soluble cytochrome b562 n=1 Tax=Halomonas cerina TaxID=447424 RepID=A0A839V5K8_9GAMM|nr:DUF6746 family protein [Halomonas cerina]MBB3190441.1 hypothetical protein [Halomonas cerina]
MKTLLFVILATGLLATTAQAEEQESPALIEGQSAETLAEAVSHLSDYNSRLSALLSQPELRDEDLAIIHDLTYTLENALSRIDKEVDAMTASVEEVQQGAQSDDRARVREHGQAYLESIRFLVK